MQYGLTCTVTLNKLRAQDCGNKMKSYLADDPNYYGSIVVFFTVSIKQYHIYYQYNKLTMETTKNRSYIAYDVVH